MNYRIPGTALASDPGTIVEWDLRAETGKAGGDPEAGWRGAQAGHSDSAGPVCAAGGAAGFAEAVGPDVFRTQLRFSSGAVGQAGSGTGAAVYRRRLRRVRGFDWKKFFDRVNHDKPM